MSFSYKIIEDFRTTLNQKLGIELEVTEIKPFIFLLKCVHYDMNIVFYLCSSQVSRIETQKDSSFVHIDEDSWVNQSEHILSRLKVRLGQSKKIYARETVVARIDKRQSMQFQEEHHMQVALPGKYRYGLFYRGELVSIGVFSGGRRMQNKPETYRSFELLRFCHKKNILVVGGLTKLLQSFSKDFRPGDLMTYSDKDWSDGHKFALVGFEITDHLPPQVFWIERETLHRYTDYDLPVALKSLGENKLIEKGFCKLTNNGSLKLVKTVIFPNLD